MYKIVSVLLLFAMAHSIGMDAPENIKAGQLWDAIFRGDRPKFDQLLAEGVSPLVPYMWNHQGGYVACRLPVVCAISCHQYDMAAKLLETSPEKQISGTKEGSQSLPAATLIEFAASKGSYECIPLLLSHGAIVDESLLAIASATNACTEIRRKEFIKEIKRILVLKNKPQSRPLDKTHKE